jgi:hypothetical protein
MHACMHTHTHKMEVYLIQIHNIDKKKGGGSLKPGNVKFPPENKTWNVCCYILKWGDMEVCKKINSHFVICMCQSHRQI